MAPGGELNSLLLTLKMEEGCQEPRMQQPCKLGMPSAYSKQDHEDIGPVIAGNWILPII